MLRFYFVILSAVLLLVSCGPPLTVPSGPALPGANSQTPNVSIKTLAYWGLKKLSKGDYPGARKYFSQGLQYSPNNCHLNFFNALSYHLQGRGGHEKLLQLAGVGYRLASRFCPLDPWPYYYDGLLQMHWKQYTSAEVLFSKAVKLSSTKGKIIKFLED